MSTIIVLTTSILLATAGQLLLKTGMRRVGEISDIAAAGGVIALIGRVLGTWQVPVGLAVFALSAIFWLVALFRVPLSTAYPVVALSYVLILGFSVLVLHERPSPVVWVGALLIMVGIALIGVGQRT